MTEIPTEPQVVEYRDKNGKSQAINSMSEADLLLALFDMLSRKAKHNHKMNKMFEVNDILSNVTKSVHQALGAKKEDMTPMLDLQIAADLGKIEILDTPEIVTITYRK
jgi:hypothetical protein